MALRTTSEASSAIQYEDFQPKSEWREEEAANILLLHLPDFQKKQMKITYVDTSRLIRVLGELPITNNRWKRFNQSFPVPENCNVQKIQGNFQNGVLTITMPKLTVTPKPVSTTSITTGKQENEKKMTPQLPKETKTEEKAQEGTGGIATQKQTDEKKTEAIKPPHQQEGLKDRPKSQIRSQVEESLKVSSATDNNTKKQKDDEKGNQGKKERSEGKEKATVSVMEQKLVSEQEENSKKRKEPLMFVDGSNEENSKKRKEALMVATGTSSDKEKEKEKSEKLGGAVEEKNKGADLSSEKVKEMKNLFDAAMKTATKGLTMEMSEPRQLLVKTGVAVLVIAALGAYIAYKYRSSRNSKH